MKGDRLYLIHIAECIDKIETYAGSLDYDGFVAQTIVQDAVLRKLQVLAESTQRLSDDFKAGHPEIEWYKIAGLRNILVHDYLGIDPETVWVVVADKLADLKSAAQKGLQE
ncbi:MAG: hypothetical protein A2521_09565 [Deltaproteobacteria bacterium RIFOXYD12_FULL_57_12]|nr:MAG: hypothetical protein A2521_09565 [Deltaproteobacteria bacterium RIFOXYD12_FULL_57_12]